MNFWDRLEKEVENHSNGAKVAEAVGIPSNSFTMWKKRHTYPKADVIVAIAEVLGTTAEYLVIGEYRNDWKAPARISGIVDDLLILDDNELEAVGILASGYAVRHRTVSHGAGTG
jgi:transcriptional regulator with XRE-family HTH domain